MGAASWEAVQALVAAVPAGIYGQGHFACDATSLLCLAALGPDTVRTNPDLYRLLGAAAPHVHKVRAGAPCTAGDVFQLTHVMPTVGRVSNRQRGQ